MSSYHTAAAVLAVLFGVVKVCIGAAMFVLSPSFVRSSPLLRFLVGTDETVAGQCIEVAIALYGLYSLLHGLAFFGVALVVTSLVTSRAMQLLVHGALGAVLTAFYSLVLYTDAPIPKLQESRGRYLLFGLNSGLMFALTAAGLRLQHLGSDVGWSMAVLARDPEPWALTVMSAALLALMLYCVRLPALSRSHRRHRTRASDVATIALIPLTSL